MIPPKKKTAAPKAAKKPATKAAPKAKKPVVKESAKTPEEKKEGKKDSGPKLSVIRIRLSAFDHTVLDEDRKSVV